MLLRATGASVRLRASCFVQINGAYLGGEFNGGKPAAARPDNDSNDTEVIAA